MDRIPLEKYDKTDLLILSDKLLDDNYEEYSEKLRKYIIPKLLEPILRKLPDNLSMAGFKPHEYYSWYISKSGTIVTSIPPISNVIYTEKYSRCNYIIYRSNYLFFNSYGDSIQFFLEYEQWI